MLLCGSLEAIFFFFFFCRLPRCLASDISLGGAQNPNLLIGRICFYNCTIHREDSKKTDRNKVCRKAVFKYGSDCLSALTGYCLLQMSSYQMAICKGTVSRGLASGPKEEKKRELNHCRWRTSPELVSSLATLEREHRYYSSNQLSLIRSYLNK